MLTKRGEKLHAKCMITYTKKSKNHIRKNTKVKVIDHSSLIVIFTQANFHNSFKNLMLLLQEKI